ncbi:PAS domain S-box protein [bacterium]|nr:PAS domain S-box protein [bacterium]
MDHFRQQLEQRLEDITCPKKRLDIWNRFVYKIISENLTEARILCLEALNYAEIIENNISEKAYCMSNLGIIERVSSNHFKALSIQLKTLPLFLKTDNKRLIGITYLEIGTILCLLCDYHSSLDYHFLAMDIFKEQNLTRLELQAKSSIGNLYSAMGNLHKAIEIYKDSLHKLDKIEKSDEYQSDRLYLITNLVGAYYDIEDFDQCIALAQSTLKLHEGYLDMRLKAALLENLGRGLLKTENPELALSMVLQGQEIAEKIDAKNILAGGFLVLGRIYLELSDPEKGLLSFKQSLDMAKKLGIKSRIKEAHKLISKFYREQNNYSAALEHFEQFHALSQEILDEESIKSINTLQILHEVNKAKLYTTTLEKKNEELNSEIRQRIKVEKDLLLSEERSRLVREATGAGIWDWNILTKKYNVDSSIKAILGYEDSEMVNNLETWLERVHPEDKKALIDAAHVHLRGEAPVFEYEHRAIHKNGSIRWLLVKGIAVRDNNENPIRMIGTYKNITTQKLAEKERDLQTAIVETKNLELRKLTKAINYGPSIVVLTDLDGTIEYVNPKFCKITGYTAEEAIGQNPRILGSGYHDIEFYKKMWETITAGNEWHGELRNKRKDKSLYWENASIAPVLDDNNKIINFIAIKEDVTSRKLMEEQLKISLREKEILLKEIHHRVKNNLAIVSSLLDLQCDSITDRNARDIFKNSQARIHTMALIHQNLYESEKLGEIEFRNYLTSLIDEISNIYDLKPPGIKFVAHLEDIVLNLETAIPLGLITNELLVNTIKHAFPNHRSGIVKIQFSKDDKDNIKLMVQDNGIGLPEGVDINNATSMGLQLISGLTEQINGNLTCRVNHGTEFSIVFTC